MADLLKGLGLIVLEIVFVWMMGLAIKFCIDRRKLYNKENQPVDLSIRLDSLAMSQAFTKDYEYAEVKVEDEKDGKTFWVTDRSALVEKDDDKKSSESPRMTYSVQDDQNFAGLLLDKK